MNTADLDQHLGLAGEPNITGVLLAETVISKAIGVLMAGSRTREWAYTGLDALANSAHTDRITEATTILTVLTDTCAAWVTRYFSCATPLTR